MLGVAHLPEWLKANSLEKLLPDDMVKTVVGRPQLTEPVPKIVWAKVLMERTKSTCRAARYGPTAGRVKKPDNMDVSNISFGAWTRAYPEGAGSVIAML